MSESFKPILTLPSERETVNSSQSSSELSIDESDISIAARFERIVRLHPDRLALKYGSSALSYEQLNQISNRLARAIIAKRGLGSEAIALFFDHGIDVVIAILGVLKAGKFYVALDPTFPAERLSYILEDSGARTILTSSCRLSAAGKLVQGHLPVLCIDEVDPSWSPDNIGVAHAATDLAMITYTSGSTGTPKGAAREQLKLLRRHKIKRQEIPIGVNDRLSLIHSVVFGSANNCLFQSLLNGASLFPFNVKEEGISRMATWLEEEQISILHSPPSVFRQLCENLLSQTRHLSLRLIRLSGASITKDDFDLYKRCFSSETSLEIHMGSTEAGAIGRAVVTAAFSYPHEGVPVGYPARGKTILLLDNDGQEVAHGDVGEIAVKSSLLHPGYWKNPELTRAKYISDPKGGEERIFLTGDLGRMLPDGFLVHLGRKDHQIKIRGYRVELGEIECVLLAHPLVKEAAAVAWDDKLGEKYLAAYVVPRTSSGLTVPELRQLVESKLPSYMVPAFLVILDCLPLTNGKVDRKSLPSPDNQRPHVDQDYVAPQSYLEICLVQIWESVLNVQPIGIHDSFLELGGHSLAATRVASHVSQRFNLDIPIKALFEHPTIAEIAQLLENRSEKATESKELAELLNEVEKLSDSEAERQVLEIEQK